MLYYIHSSDNNILIIDNILLDHGDGDIIVIRYLLLLKISIFLMNIIILEYIFLKSQSSKIVF